MMMKRNLQALSLILASMTLCFGGCATIRGAVPFRLTSERTQQPPATPSQFTAPAVPPATPAGGYHAQLASNSTGQARPQRRYRAPACNAGTS